MGCENHLSGLRVPLHRCGSLRDKRIWWEASGPPALKQGDKIMKKIFTLVILASLITTAAMAGGNSKRGWIQLLPKDNVGYFPAGIEVDDGDIDLSADTLTQDGPYVMEPTSVVNIDTATVVTALDSFIVVVGSNSSGGFAVTNTGILLSTSAVYALDGQEVRLMGTSDTNTVKFSESTTLQLNGGTTYTLGLGDNVSFQYYGGVWYEVHKSTGI